MKALLSALERRTLFSKLILGFASLLLLSVLIGAFSLQTQLALNDQIQQSYDADLLGVSNAKDMQIDYLRMEHALRQALVAPDVERREQALAQVANAELQMRKELEELRARIFRSEGKVALARFDDEFGRYKRSVDKAVVLMREARFNEAMARINSDEFQSSGKAVASAISLVVQGKEEGARQGAEAANQLASYNTRFTILLILGGVGFGVLMTWLIVQSIRRPSERVRTAVEMLARGDLGIDVPHGDYSNEIGGLARAIQVLQTGARQIEEQSWIKSNLALLSNALQTATTFSELCQVLFSTIAPLVKIGHGVLYVHEEEHHRLRLLGAYAHRQRKTLDQYFAFGQGLVGQCAMERTPILLSDPPADYVRIGSSLGEAVPRSIAALPILRSDRLLGVLELATFANFGVREQALLDALLPILAMNLEILERSVRAKKLLEETQAQAHAMQEQAATLKEQAEELEDQQATLKETEAWFRSIIESAPDGMLVCNERGIITLANPVLETMFGYAPGELPGQAIEVLVPQAIRGTHVELREGYALSGGMRAMGSLGSELRGVRKDGTTFSVEVGLSKLPAVGGRSANVCASVRDITERKLAEERMAALEERSRLILGSVKDGIAGLDADGQLTFVNPAVTTLLGYSEEELLGQKMHALMHHTYPDGRHFPRAECSMYLTSVDGVARTVDNEVLWRKDATPLPVEYSTTPVYKDGTLVGTVVAFRDITQRKAAEVLLGERLEELERFNRLTIDREERMIALKVEINSLLAQDGLAPKYRIVE